MRWSAVRCTRLRASSRGEIGRLRRAARPRAARSTRTLGSPGLWTETRYLDERGLVRRGEEHFTRTLCMNYLEVSPLDSSFAVAVSQPRTQGEFHVAENGEIVRDVVLHAPTEPPGTSARRFARSQAGNSNPR